MVDMHKVGWHARQCLPRTCSPCFFCHELSASHPTNSTAPMLCELFVALPLTHYKESESPHALRFLVSWECLCLFLRHSVLNADYVTHVSTLFNCPGSIFPFNIFVLWPHVILAAAATETSGLFVCTMGHMFRDFFCAQS